MKPNTIANACRIAAAMALTLWLAPSAQAQVKGCSNATLKGTFAYTLTGFLTAPAVAGPFAETGTQIFDGNGGTTASAMLSQNGNIVRVTIKGTYTVNDDCTGTFTLQVAPFGITNQVFFVLDSGANGFQSIEVNPSSGVITGVGRRQFPVGDLRN